LGAVARVGDPVILRMAGERVEILAKHSKSFSLLDSISVGIDRMQRNFEPM